MGLLGVYETAQTSQMLKKMPAKLLDKLEHLNPGDKLKINGRLYIIKKKSKSKAAHEYASNIIRYELGNDYVLEYDHDWKFLQCVTKKAFFGLVTTTKAHYIDIKDIRVV